MLQIRLPDPPAGLSLRTLSGLLLRVDELLTAVVRETAGARAPAGWTVTALSLHPPTVNLVPDPPLPVAVETVLDFLDWVQRLPDQDRLPLSLPALEHLRELLHQLDRQGLHLSLAWEDRPPAVMDGGTGRRLAALTGREPPEAAAWVGRLEMLNVHSDPCRAALYEEGTALRLPLEFARPLLPAMKALLDQRVLLEGTAAWADRSHSVLQRVTVTRVTPWEAGEEAAP
ncbi:MAG: hypothetical protein OWV35_08600 [Firmicutes bacterium]|nr:hypothetical protein [Bacillota bacterium]